MSARRFIALALLAAAPAVAGEVEPEPLRRLEGTLFRMDGLAEVASTRLGSFVLESAGEGDLRQTPGTAELSLFSGGTLRVSDGLASDARAVDVRTGRPLATPGTGLCDPEGLFGPPDGSGCLAPGASGPQSRRLFDDLCAVTVGLVRAVVPALAGRCLLDLVNENGINVLTGTPITNPLTQPTFSGFFSNLFVGNRVAVTLAQVLAPGAAFVPLSRDPGDLAPASCSDAPVNCFYASGSPVSDGSNPVQFPTLQTLLTEEQQALLGCGPFYGTNCEVEGISLFDAEGAVGVQAFPQIAPGEEVATRVDPATGAVVILPGARGPTDPGYDPLVDGCIAPAGTFPGDESCAPDAPLLLDPLTGELFPNELAALSYNLMLALASLSLPDPDCAPDPTSPFCDPTVGDPGCALSSREELMACSSLRSTLAVLARELEDDPSGPPRRRWLWESGAEFMTTDEATEDLVRFATWTVHAVGPEVSRRDDRDEAGVLFALFPAPLEMAQLDERLAAGGQDFLLLYGVVPEPSPGLLGLAGLLAVAALAARRQRS